MDISGQGYEFPGGFFSALKYISHNLPFPTSLNGTGTNIQYDNYEHYCTNLCLDLNTNINVLELKMFSRNCVGHINTKDYNKYR